MQVSQFILRETKWDYDITNNLIGNQTRLRDPHDIMGSQSRSMDQK